MTSTTHFRRYTVNIHICPFWPGVKLAFKFNLNVVCCLTSFSLVPCMYEKSGSYFLLFHKIKCSSFWNLIFGNLKKVYGSFKTFYNTQQGNTITLSHTNWVLVSFYAFHSFYYINNKIISIIKYLSRTLWRMINIVNKII